MIDDYIIIKVEPDASIDTPGLKERLNVAADRMIVAQYKGKRPTAILLRTEWIITSDWRDVEQYQPDHDCAQCRAANDQAIAFLKEHPEERLALGNLHYEEIW